MSEERDPAAIAREIIDANLYMVLGTADEAGRPWAAPLYFAESGYASSSGSRGPSEGTRGISSSAMR